MDANREKKYWHEKNVGEKNDREKASKPNFKFFYTNKQLADQDANKNT